jgi:hypothetical protein
LLQLLHERFILQLQSLLFLTRILLFLVVPKADYGSFKKTTIDRALHKRD